MITELNISVREIMSSSVLFARLGQAFMEICRLFLELNIHHLPVVNEKGELVGMLSSNDVLHAFAFQLPMGQKTDEDLLNRTFKVEELMTPQPLFTIGPEDSLIIASRLFTQHKIHALPVIENGQLIGIITANDLTSYFASKEEEIRFV